MMRMCPNLYQLEDLVTQARGDNYALVGGAWVPARPIGFISFARRLKCTWLVFTGRADAVVWPSDQT